MGAAAQKTLEEVKRRGQINVGYRASGAPFSLLGGDGVPTGYAVQMCQSVVERLKTAAGGAVRVKYIDVPIDQMVRLVQTGGVDVMCSATSDTPERRNHMAFSSAIFVDAAQVMVSRKAGVTGLEQLKGGKVVVIGRTSSEKLARELAPSRGWTVRQALDPEAALGQLQIGWVSGYLRDGVLLAQQRVQTPQPDDYVILPEALSTERIALAYRRADDAMAQLVQAALADNVRTGLAESAYRRWFLEPVAPASHALGIPMSPALKAEFDALR